MPTIYVTAICQHYMKSTFPKCDKRQPRNRVCNANVKFVKECFINIGIATPFSGMALIAFWQRAIYIVLAYSVGI